MRQFGKFETHKVFLHFPNLALAQNLSPGTKNGVAAVKLLRKNLYYYIIIMYLK